LTTTTYPKFPRITNQITRALAQREQQTKLIDHLKGVAYFGSLVAYDSATLHQRCTLARLVAATDDALRQLCNQTPQERR
jgi:hypothetical protein